MLARQPGQSRAEFAMYLAVLPKYREACIGHLRDSLGDSLELFAASAHLEPSVKTGISNAWYKDTGIIRIAGKAFIQYRHFNRAMRADNLIVDLNPRSVTAWLLLISRRRRRTLVWGHLYPKAGKNASTSRLRRAMRRLANGTISYTYTHRDAAVKDLPGQPVWVAPNALYDRALMTPSDSDEYRDAAVYVGRLVASKKVHLLIEAMAILAPKLPNFRMVLVGDGEELHELVGLATKFGIEDSIEFLGWVDNVVDLQTVYSSAFCSLSPGFAGLGLTQSLGFGVPMIVSRDEEHSPEIELATTGGVSWFETDSAQSLARAIETSWEAKATLPLSNISKETGRMYSAEAMSFGLECALTGKLQDESAGY